jgi:hypothetical protein
LFYNHLFWEVKTKLVLEEAVQGFLSSWGGSRCFAFQGSVFWQGGVQFRGFLCLVGEEVAGCSSGVCLPARQKVVGVQFRGFLV